MAPDLSFHPPGVIPPRKSSTGMANGTAYHLSSSAAGRYSMKTILENGSPQPTVSEKLPTTTDMSPNHTRNRSSVDGTKYKDGTWSPDKEKILMGPYDYMAKHPGKDIRRQLITAFNAWLKVPSESVEVINKVVAMLHNASLLIDDVEDSSVLRRGIPVAHNIFGTAQTINSANYVYFLALQEVQKLNNVEAIDIYVKELLNLHRGQGMDLFWRDTLTCPSEDDYLEMVGNKTGGLFRLAVKLMQAESVAGKDCVALVNVMGLIFQICDDYLNLSDTTYTKNKGLCEDLTEGKFSFPIIHSIRSDPSNLQLINILKQRTKDEEVKLYAVSYMKSTGSFAYTRKVVRELRDKALSLIDEIDGKQPVYGEQQMKEGPADGAMVRAIIEKIVESTLKDEDDEDGETDV